MKQQSIPCESTEIVLCAVPTREGRSDSCAAPVPRRQQLTHSAVHKKPFGPHVRIHTHLRRSLWRGTFRLPEDRRGDFNQYLDSLKTPDGYEDTEGAPCRSEHEKEARPYLFAQSEAGQRLHPVRADYPCTETAGTISIAAASAAIPNA